MPKTYNSKAKLNSARYPALVAAVVPPNTNTIKPETKLVSVEGCASLLKDEKGLSLTAETINHWCRTGKWTQGVFWVKKGRSRLINMDAVNHWIAFGE